MLSRARRVHHAVEPYDWNETASSPLSAAPTPAPIVAMPRGESLPSAESASDASDADSADGSDSPRGIATIGAGVGAADSGLDAVSFQSYGSTAWWTRLALDNIRLSRGCARDNQAFLFE